MTDFLTFFLQKGEKRGDDDLAWELLIDARRGAERRGNLGASFGKDC